MSQHKLRSVNTHFWDDNYIITLDPIEKLLFLYLITNPLTTIAGIYEIALRRIAFDTGIEAEMVLKILKRFEEADKVTYREGWIFLHNFFKNQNLSDTAKKGALKVVNDCPHWIKDSLCIDYDSLCIAYDNKKGNKKVKKKKEKEEKEEEVEEKIESESAKRGSPDALSEQIHEVFDYWREKMETPRSKLIEVRRTKVRARLKEGYTVDQLKDAIDGNAMSAYHQGANENGTLYNDLELICRNGVKVEGFIQIKENPKNETNNGRRHSTGNGSGNGKQYRTHAEALRDIRAEYEAAIREEGDDQTHHLQITD